MPRRPAAPVAGLPQESVLAADNPTTGPEKSPPAPAATDADMPDPDPDPDTEPRAGAHFPLAVAAELQDHLLAVDLDLDRLQALLAQACQTLIASFNAASAPLQAVGDEATLVEFGRAISALQFQDLASQLVDHSRCRLRLCVDEIARQTFASDAEDPLPDDGPLRPNPVTQSVMGAGSIELF